MEKEFISYDHYSRLLEELVTKINQYQYAQTDENKIKYVCGIPRGGLPIAVHLSHYLDIPMVEELNNFDYDFKENELLVIDDIADTGLTLNRLKKKFLTATLFYKKRSCVKPDFYVREVSAWQVFPWEKPNEIPNRT